jgi:hypothetical protein
MTPLADTKSLAGIRPGGAFRGLTAYEWASSPTLSEALDRCLYYYIAILVWGSD